MVKFPFVRIWSLFNYDSFMITKEGKKALEDEYGIEPLFYPFKWTLIL